MTDEGDFLACTSPGGSPKGLPYPIPKEFLENRMGGVCPSCGPVWDRPLREKRNRLFIRRRGGPMWPPAMEGSLFVGRGLPDAPFHLHAKRRRGGACPSRGPASVRPLRKDRMLLHMP